MSATPPNPDVFHAIAHPVRRDILDLLTDDDLSVTKIAGHFDISRPAVSQHLAILLDSGLVSRQSSGRLNVYHLQPGGLEAVAKWVRHYERFWSRKLDALGDYLDTIDDNTDGDEHGN